MSKPQNTFDPPWQDGWSIAVIASVVGQTIRALLYLIAARLRFSRLEASEISELNRRARDGGRRSDGASPADRRRLAMVSAVLPRVAHRLPWRSDCLIQAMAAQSWLLHYGIASQIEIGVDKDAEEGFLSHAWLTYGDHAVCGGDLSRYTVLLQQKGDTTAS